MQWEEVKDPFFMRLDRRHNPIMVAAPDLSMRCIKRGVWHHAVNQRYS
jgi:hypothetical protein